MTEAFFPVVPDELTPLVDERVLEVHQKWSHYSLSDVRTMMPGLTAAELSDGRKSKAAIVESPNGYEPESPKIVLSLAHCQRWQPSTFIFAKLTQEIVDPQASIIVLPNNGIQSEYYDFSPEELEKLHSGNLTPFAELQVRLLEALRAGRTALTGYSLGGRMAVEIAAVGSDKLDITHVNADEAPNKQRAPKELQSDFTHSGAWRAQQAAIRDAALPCLSEAQSFLRLGAGYLRFPLAAYWNKNNSALRLAMASGMEKSFQSAAMNYPEAKRKLGYVIGSRLFEPTPLTSSLALVREYSGKGAHAHATGDNAIAQALMAKDGITQLA